MPNLAVKGLPSGEEGRWLIRVNREHRSGVDRYGVAKITNLENEKSLYVLVLGHEENDAIFIPYDIRTRLGLVKGAKLNFKIDKVGLWGKLRWYVGSPDPAVHVPAWIAIGGVLLAIFGILMTVPSLVCPAA